MSPGSATLSLPRLPLSSFRSPIFHLSPSISSECTYTDGFNTRGNTGSCVFKSNHIGCIHKITWWQPFWYFILSLLQSNKHKRHSLNSVKRLQKFYLLESWQCRQKNMVTGFVQTFGSKTQDFFDTCFETKIYFFKLKVTADQYRP